MKTGPMATLDYTDTSTARLDVEFYFAAAHRLPRYVATISAATQPVEQ